MRASIGVDAARHCAGRASAEERASIQELAEAAAGLIGRDEQTLDFTFAVMWGAIVVGSDNIAYRLALNSLMEAMMAFGDIASQIRPTDADGIRNLGEAIAEGDGEAAGVAARHLLESDVEAYEEAFDLDGTGEDDASS